MKIAIVGTGISGLVCAHHLHRLHELTLFERNDHVGGHTRTVEVPAPDGGRRAVDTGFIVFNDWTYPNFIRLLDELGVPSQPSSMSFSVHCERTGLEYNGTSLNTLFAQRRNLLRPRFWRMLRDILRFNRQAPSLLEQPDTGLTLGDYLRTHRYGREFRDYYLVPMGAAIWSAAPSTIENFPALFFIRFFHNHGMLSVDQRPQWRVVRGGSSRYLEPLLRPFADRLRLGLGVDQIVRTEAGVTLWAGGQSHSFDAVVLACHSDQALAMLAAPTAAEQAVLAAIPYQPNDILLHTDTRLLPDRQLAWASWNYRIPAAASQRVVLSYDMNILQSLPTKPTYVVTLNAKTAVDPAQVLFSTVYEHPQYTLDSVAAQARWGELSGVGHTYYCGAYWRNGFHEDGVVSALRVCQQLGVDLEVR